MSLLDAGTNLWLVFNLSATMARHGGRVQLEQSDMRMGLNKAKMATGWFLRGTIEETNYLIKEPRAEAQEEMKQGVESPGHTSMKAAMERHPVRLHQNHMDECLPCQNSTAMNMLTGGRPK